MSVTLISSTLISSPADLPADPPPGLFVLVQEEPAVCAAALAASLGSGPPRTPAQAAEELVAAGIGAPPEGRGPGAAEGPGTAFDPAPERDAEALDAVRARRVALEDALDEAREEAAEAMARVPASARRAGAERLQSVAAAVRAAEDAVLGARSLLGERPELPADAAEVAIAAEGAVIRAHRRRTAGVARSSKLLLAANAVGLLVVAGRVVTPAAEPAFVLVAAFPVAALLHMATTCARHTWQARRAARSRATALRAAGMATMTGLVARHARLQAWTARADALASAEASLEQARRRWSAVAGAPADRARIGALLRTVAEADRTAAVLAHLEAEAEAEAEAGQAAAAAAPPPPAPDPVVAPDHRGPLVILIDGPAEQPLEDGTRLLLERWHHGGTSAAVVVVTARTEVLAWAHTRTAGGSGGGRIVDLRERVLVGLDRLRARAASFGDHSPPGSMAAGG